MLCQRHSYFREGERCHTGVTCLKWVFTVIKSNFIYCKLSQVNFNSFISSKYWSLRHRCSESLYRIKNIKRDSPGEGILYAIQSIGIEDRKELQWLWNLITSTYFWDLSSLGRSWSLRKDLEQDEPSRTLTVIQWEIATADFLLIFISFI